MALFLIDIADGVMLSSLLRYVGLNPSSGKWKLVNLRALVTCLIWLISPIS